MRKTLFILLLVPSLLFAQIPNGYYDSAEGLYQEDLRIALSNIIDNHHVQSYDDLWTDFQTTDRKSNGKVWDMYSDVPGGTPAYQYTFVSDQCGNYSGEGSCYNREHSMPKSWYNDASPMYTDLFHLYPTDGYVNGQRSNLPFGEVGSSSWTSTNGSKKGSSNYPGYSGTVFEPIDEYKGDFARSYFYMLTRYRSQISSWNSAMFSGNNFSEWSKDMLLEWAENDPVSQKEIDRNNDVYNIQNNRNPFIDRPEFANNIWGDNSSVDKIENYLYINIYPNPVVNVLKIEFVSSSAIELNSEIEILDITGKTIRKKPLRDATQNQTIKSFSYNIEINISEFNKGIYFVKLNESVRKFVKS